MEKKNNKQEPANSTSQARDKNSGRFVKGHKKVGGRKIGSPNKYGNIRDRLKEKLMPLLEDIDVTIMSIDDPKERADVLSKYLPYFLPRYSNTTISADASRPIAEEQRLMELDDQYKKRETNLNVKKLTIVNNNFGDADPDDNSGINLADLGLE